MNDELVILSITSICITLVVRHVNIIVHLLLKARPPLIQRYQPLLKRRSWCQTIIWQISHILTLQLSSEIPTGDTSVDN